MQRDGPKQRLMAIFLQELQERTRAIERDLLSLDQSTGPAERDAHIQSLLHAAHSLKGAAGLVEIKPIEMVCHRIEDLLIAARDGTLDLNRATVQLLLGSKDALAEAGRRLARGETLAAAPLDAIRSELTAIVRDSPTAASPTPSDQDHAIATFAEPNGEDGADATELSQGEDSSIAAEAYARVPAAKLDILLKQSGELVIARSRTKLRIEQLSALQDLVRSSSFRSGAALAARRFASAPSSPAIEGRPAGVIHASKRGLRTDDDNLLSRMSRGLQELATGLSSDRRAIEQAANSLDIEVRRARLQPFASACAGLDRLIRDLSIGSGKEAYLEISGGEAEIDRSIAEGLQDILRHLVRNAVDHGIESTEERRSSGKPPRGKITIAAALAGDRISIRVTDDGRGLNTKEIQEQARKAPLSGESEDPLRQIFLPGLSTSPTVTTTSGRGIGLDIVKTMVERMRGAVDVSHEAGQGATFTLTLPTSLGTIRALLLKVGEQILAIDTSSVDRLIRVSPDDVRFAEGRMLVLTGSGPAPALDLRDWLGLAPDDAVRPEKRPAVVLNEIGKGAAILVDAVLAEQEFLVRTIGPRLQNLRDYAGGSILPDGTIALVINAASLGEDAFKRRSTRSEAPDRVAPFGRRILIADDSLTTRTLEKTILEGAGYEVLAAADGEQAWQMLQKSSADLVLADVDMPGLDGFTLTERLRQSAQFRHVPVILLTARENAEDKKRGLEAGADAYLVKSAFDQRELLRAIAELI